MLVLFLIERNECVDYCTLLNLLQSMGKNKLAFFLAELGAVFGLKVRQSFSALVSCVPRR